MSQTVFDHALQLCYDYDDAPFLGGGEPTLHPLFELFLLNAIGTNCNGIVGIVTNGGVTKKALTIAVLASKNVIWAALSQDEFHDPIDQAVVDAFTRLPYPGSIRDNSLGGTREPLPHGRGKVQIGWSEENEDTRDEYDCPCCDWMIIPNGDIKQCGCEDSPIIGNVYGGIEPCSAIPGQCHLSTDYILRNA